MRPLTAEQVFTLLQHACNVVGRDIGQGALKPGQLAALTVHGKLWQPCCAGAHVFVRAFGAPTVQPQQETAPVIQLERAFRLCLKSNYQVSPRHYGQYWQWLNGPELSHMQALNDHALLEWDNVRPRLVEAIRGLGSVCKSVIENIIPVVDLDLP